MNENRSELDDVTADRLLGGLAPDDAPQGYQRVAAALQAAAAMATEAPTHGSDAAASAFLNAIPRRNDRMKKWKIAVATVAGGLALSTGLAAADVLPSGAQNAASSALSHVGIRVPGNDDDNTNVSTVKDDDQGTDDAKPEQEQQPQEHPDNHGSVVSNAAHDDSTQGREHGATVSNIASNGKSHAGEDHPSADDHPTADDNAGETHRSEAGTTHSGGANSGTGSSNSGSSSSGGSGSSINQGSSSGGSGSSNSVSSGSGSSD